MKLRRVDHVDLLVKDIDQAVGFYQKLGLVVQGTLEAGKTVFLWNQDEASPLVVELHETKEGEAPGLGHVAFLVDDVGQAYKEGREEGIVFDYEPRHSNESGRTVTTFLGPDAVGLQLARKTGRGEYEDFK